MNWKIPLADLDYDEEEEQVVLSVLRSKWLTMGSETQAFEQEFAAMTGSRYSLAVSNATEALHLACLASGIAAGDEVIVPSLTFVATANAVLYCGAEVRFADICGANDLTLDPQSVEEQITPRTKAIITMHYAGYPSQMERLQALAKEHHLVLIEDAAHAPGAWLNGKHLGTFGDVGCFSFFSNKNLATGEGGMLVTESADLAEKIRLLRSHGMTSLTWDRHQGHAYSYDVVGLGYNYRIDEIRSSLGRVQLRKLVRNNQRRAEITRAYWRGLAGLGLELPFAASGLADSIPAYHIFPILLPPGVNRLNFIDQLRQAGIQTSIHYPPIHTFSYYRQRYPTQPANLLRTEEAAGREVTLPLYPGMTDEQNSWVIEAVRTALER